MPSRENQEIVPLYGAIDTRAIHLTRKHRIACRRRTTKAPCKSELAANASIDR